MRTMAEGYTYKSNYFPLNVYIALKRTKDSVFIRAELCIFNNNKEPKGILFC